MNNSYTVLEPSITNQLGVGSLSFSTNGVVSFATSVSLLWTLGILACVAATGFVFVKGGLFRMQASEAGIRKSNDEFKRGALGLLGVLSLFLLIFTINKGLLVGDVGLSALQTSVSAGGTTGGLTAAIPASPAAGAPSGGTGTGAVNLQALNAAGISINHNNVPCTAAQMVPATPSRIPPCTSVDQLPQASISMLVSLRNACGCTVLLTGGTEPGHSTHGVGRNAVDLNKNTTLDNFIRANGTMRDQTHYVWGGFTFYDEAVGATTNTTGVHWHVSR